MIDSEFQKNVATPNDPKLSDRSAWLGDVEEDIIREVVFVERITPDGRREITGTFAACRLPSGRLLPEQEFDLLASEYLSRRESLERPLWGYPHVRFLGEMFESWPRHPSVVKGELLRLYSQLESEPQSGQREEDFRQQAETPNPASPLV